MATAYRIRVHGKLPGRNQGVWELCHYVTTTEVEQARGSVVPALVQQMDVTISKEAWATGDRSGWRWHSELVEL